MKPMGTNQMQAAMKELQDSIVILARIERTDGGRGEPAQVDSQSEKLWLRIDKNMGEISEKLNRLIGPR